MNGAGGPTGRAGQGLAVLLLLAAAGLVWFGAVLPARDWYVDRQQTLEQRRTMLSHVQALAAAIPALEAEAAAGRPRQQTSLPGSSDAVAAANLQERVQAMAVQAGATLSAVETLPPEPAGTWHKVALRISVSAPWPVLIDLIRAIEASPAGIVVDDVHFHSAAVVNAVANAPLQASLVLYGLRPAGAGT